MAIRVGDITVGTDAELPVYLIDGTPFPITGLVGGTKENPRPLPKLGPGYFVQEDGAMLEFNVPAATTSEGFATSIERILRYLRKELPPTLRIGDRDIEEYKVEFLKADPSLLRLGCTPDYSVYTGAENPRPHPTKEGIRTAAGHVHIGWKDPTNEEREELVKWCDVHLALPWLGHDSFARRDMYGKAGSYRPKEYGVEYRVLGNAWVTQNPSNIFNSVIEAVKAVEAGKKVPVEYYGVLQEKINTGKVKDTIAWNQARKWIYNEGLYI